MEELAAHEGILLELMVAGNLRFTQRIVRDAFLFRHGTVEPQRDVVLFRKVEEVLEAHRRTNHLVDLEVGLAFI